MNFYKLPRGIQETKRANKDGSYVVAYRVQMNRQGVKLDKLFSSLNQALVYLNNERKNLGLKGLVIEEDKEKLKEYKNKIYKELSETKNGEDFIKQYFSNPTFDRYVQRYIDDFLNIKYRNTIKKNLSEMTAEEKHKHKNYTNKASKLKRIVKFKVQEEDSGVLEMSLMHKFNREQVRIGDIPLREITPSTINSYVKTRIEDNLRASSIRAEIVLINSVIDYAKSIDTSLKDYKNPVKDFDKKLYSIAVPAKPKFFRFNETSKEEFIKVIESNKNQDFIFIVKLIMMTAMRRAEVVLLKWSQIYENFIQLTDTKTNPRPVYLTTEAKALINSIPRKTNQDRVFNYTVTGFEASLRYHLNKFGLRDITAHKLRKNSISEFVEVIGSNNSLLISEILGIRDIAGLEREIKTMPTSSPNSQTEVLKSVGHTNSAVTKKHYFSLSLNNKK